MTSSRRRARGGQPAPVSASMTLGLAGFSGAIHPGEEGDTNSSADSLQPERRAEARFLDHTTMHRRGGRGGYVLRKVVVLVIFI